MSEFHHVRHRCDVDTAFGARHHALASTWLTNITPTHGKSQRTQITAQNHESSISYLTRDTPPTILCVRDDLRVICLLTFGFKALNATRVITNGWPCGLFLTGELPGVWCNNFYCKSAARRSIGSVRVGRPLRSSRRNSCPKQRAPHCLGLQQTILTVKTKPSGRSASVNEVSTHTMLRKAKKGREYLFTRHAVTPKFFGNTNVHFVNRQGGCMSAYSPV